MHRNLLLTLFLWQILVNHNLVLLRFYEIKGIVTKDGKTLHIKDNGIEIKADNKVNISGKNLTLSSYDSLIMSARKKVRIKSDMVEINADKDISIQKK